MNPVPVRSTVLLLSFLFLTSVLTSCGASQSATNNTGSTFSLETSKMIEWPGPLTWSDYRMAPPAHELDAATHIVIESPRLDEKTNQWTIRAFMIPDSSWTRGEDDILLMHEQKHFDLAEIYVREYRKEMSQLPANQRDARAYSIYQRIISELCVAEEQYDQETGHGIKMEPQRSWSAKISEGINNLRAYADNTPNAYVNK